MQTVYNKVISRIYGKRRGWSFSKKDFSGLGRDDAVRQALSRLEKKGIIRRVCRGLYDFPKHSELLDQKTSPDFNTVAQAIARKSGWTIRPTGSAALNFLGISTQVPSKILYLSDGPTKKISAPPWTIHFKNSALKEIKLKPKTSLMVQAIKSLGREQFGAEQIGQLRNAFTDKERKQIVKDASIVTGWVYALIQKICNEGGNG